MKSRHASRSASCLYMLGFLSGLAFIILCGSSAAYNNRGRSPEKLEDVVVKAPPQNTLPQPETQTIGDIEILFGRTDKGDEFTVQALGIEPNAQVSVELRNKEQVLTTKTVSADDMGSISVRLGPLSETLSLERIEVIVSSGARAIFAVFPISHFVSAPHADAESVYIPIATSADKHSHPCTHADLDSVSHVYPYGILLSKLARRVLQQHRVGKPASHPARRPGHRIQLGREFTSTGRNRSKLVLGAVDTARSFAGGVLQLRAQRR